MYQLEDYTDVFIIRIWYERPKSSDAPVKWRGVIEHIPSKERHYFESFFFMLAFMSEFIFETQ